MSESSYPLSWPTAWPRTPETQRRHATFERRIGATTWTIERARRELAAELDRLGAEDPILSTSLRLRLDGAPASNQGQPVDPGAAVYFTLAGKRTVLACDRWVRVEHNIRAIALHIDALRGMGRWGVGSVEQAFLGYAALPQQASPSSWRRVLGFDAHEYATPSEVKARFNARALKAHPDTGGSVEEFRELVQARDAAIAELEAVSRG